jgi:Ca2+-binding RTX toxin-like protein
MTCCPGARASTRCARDEGNDRFWVARAKFRIECGPGFDTVRGGAGNDTIVSVDGERDVIDCGPGRDTVTADRHDIVRRCDRRHD